ncbi:MAG: ATP-binding protein [Oscillospiraceae bacterium]|nr:ATP-binding protein [Oscillospiraceae bacterium]
MAYIERSITPYIQRAERSFKAVLLTGARQTGKSTLLKRMFPQRKYVTFDDPFFEEQAAVSPQMFLSLNAPPVTFDEVQRVPQLFRYLKMECDNRSAYGLYCLSGSQPFRLMKNVSESLSGRVSIVELSGLSLREIQADPFERPFLPTMDYVLARQQSVRKPEDIWAIIHRGSYPELYQNPALDWQQFYAGYVKTYLERDVRELSAVQDLDVFRRFMVAVAARTGQMVNYANIADEIGKDAATVRNWMSILEASGIIYLLEPYTPAVLRRAIKTPKLYFRDTGLAAYLTRWLTPETLACGAMSGNMFETYVISEILKSYANQGIDYRYCVSYYRGKDKRRVTRNGDTMEVEGEIDFIIEENGTLYPIEIKKNTAETAYAASAFQVLDRVEDKTRGMGAVISLCPAPGLLRENVMELPVWYL